MNIPEFSVKRSVTVLMMIAIIVVIGSISFSRLGLDLMPEITYPVISVVIGYPGVGPEDVEQTITKPIEELIATVKHVKEINSISMEGLGAMMVEFEWGASLETGAQDIRDRIELLSDFLPEDMERPMVLKFDPSMMPIMSWGVMSNSGRNLQSLRTITEEILKDRLEQIDGVASCMVWGGQQREILIELDRQKLDAYSLSIDAITGKLASENLNLPGGYVQDKHTEYILRTTGEYQTVDEIKNTPIVVRNNVPIYLKDIANVIDTIKEERAHVRTNKKGSVILILSKESGANTVIVSQKIYKELKKIKEALPPDIEMHVSFDQAEFIQRIISVTGSNAAVGGLLAIIVLYFFLRNLRPTITIGLSIPLSILATFIPLYFLGQTLNFVTMIGIALGVGMLVDNAIVVIENIYRHFRLGEDRITAAIKGASEVGMAITTSTLTTVVVFLPLVFATGITGKLFEGLAMSISFALVASLVVSLTIVPMVTSKVFMERHGQEDKKAQREMNLILPLQQFYKKLIAWSLTHKIRVALIVFVILVSSLLVAVFFVGKEFFPETDQNMAFVSISLPIGTPLEETNRLSEHIEDLFLKEDDVDNAIAIAGLAEGGKQDAAFGTGPEGPHEAQLYIRLKDKLDRKKTTKQIIEQVRGQVPKLEGVKVEFIDMGKAMMTGGGRQQKPIDIKIFGKDLRILKSLANMLESILYDIKGISDVSISLDEGKPELHINVNREKASRLGLSGSYIANYVKDAVQGKVATRYRTGGDEIDVRVRLREADRDAIEDIRNLSIPLQIGGQIGGHVTNFRSPEISNMSPYLSVVALKEVSDAEYNIGPIRLQRENQKRLINVSANVTDRDLGSVSNEVKKKLNNIKLPEGYFFEFGGEIEQMTETFIDLGLIFLLAIILIYMVMAAQLESLMHPFVIMFSVPFSIIGVILALLVSGKTISLPAGMGVLILSGIIVNNGIVMVDYINQLRAKGKSKFDAIIKAGMTRLRPVLMTASTTMLGMLPMALSRMEGSEVRSVTASAIIGGMFIGTFLTLIVLPLIYDTLDSIGEKISSRLAWIVRREK